MLRTPLAWYLALVAACMILPYLLRVRPRRQKDWTVLAFALGFSPGCWSALDRCARCDVAILVWTRLTCQTTCFC
jgi:hypothetical protein